MSDDLIKFLRTSTNSCFNKTAANLIEELESEVKEYHGEAMAWIEKWGTAEAKLAKAMVALQAIADDPYADIKEVQENARKVLAELES
jgi:type I site-specific restriction endonuclease